MSTHEELVERVAKAMAAPLCGQWDDLMGQEKAHYLTHARAAIFELAPELRHDPPEGCEWVALPTETVDWFATTRTLIDGTPGWVVGDACRDAVARRPKPERRTERVSAIEAIGREVVSDKGSDQPTFTGYSISGRLTGGLVIRAITGDCWQRIAPDGKVTVLAKDGAEDGAE